MLPPVHAPFLTSSLAHFFPVLAFSSCRFLPKMTEGKPYLRNGASPSFNAVTTAPEALKDPIKRLSTAAPVSGCPQSARGQPLQCTLRSHAGAGAHPAVPSRGRQRVRPAPAQHEQTRRGEVEVAIPCSSVFPPGPRPISHNSLSLATLTTPAERLVKCAEQRGGSYVQQQDADMRRVPTRGVKEVVARVMGPASRLGAHALPNSSTVAWMGCLDARDTRTRPAIGEPQYDAAV